MSNSKEPHISIRFQNNEVLCNLTSFVNVYVYHCYHGYIHIPSLYMRGIIYEPEDIDPLKSLGCEVYSLSKFVKTNSL